MSDLENEEIINYFVIHNKEGRVFTSDKDNRWGGLIEPKISENPNKTDEGINVVLFASWDFGYLMLETLKEFENKFSDRFNLVGLVTDDPLNPNAKISLKKRVWHLLDLPHRVIDETFIIESALCHGVPVYTGEVKTEFFREILKKWNADAIIVCVFGQVIDSYIIDFPKYGIYNFHPSDLSMNYGAGPAPYDDLSERGAKKSVWTVHHVCDEVDCGKVVGKSPDVNVLDIEGKLPENPILVYHKLAEVLSPLAYCLVNQLCENYEVSKTGPINHIDFEQLIPLNVKESILKPINQDIWTDVFSVPENYLFKSGQNISESDEGADS